jgi:hypothetical protein
MAKWQVEMPSLVSSTSHSTLSCLSTTNKRLLQYWFEKTSQIMVIDPDENPMSYPIIQHLQTSSSLLHAILSISSAYENDFTFEQAPVTLNERDLALSMLQAELRSNQCPPVSSLFTVFMLGWSSSWIDQDKTQLGMEHLCGARVILDTLLDNATEIDFWLHFAVGTYIYWYMACALMVNPHELKPLDTPAIADYVQSFKNTYHPIAGFSLEMFYVLGRLGRYCREVLEDGKRRDLLLELALEEELSNWTPPHDDRDLSLLGDSFRKHGLVILHQRWGSGHTMSGVSEDATDGQLFPAEIHRAVARRYALDIVENLRQIPLSSWYLNIQSIPLLTAGSELTSEDVEERKEVLKRFSAIYSMNRCPVNMWACDLLEEIWAMKAKGNSNVTWLALMVQRGWRWSMA